MATSQKISNLNEVSSPNIEDVFPIVNNGETKKVTLDVVIQQASITMASYINNLLLAYAPTTYVNSLVASASAAGTNYTDTRINTLSTFIDSEYAKISYVDVTFIPVTDRVQIIIDAVLQGYNDFIPLTDRQTIISEASSAGFEAGSEYADVNFIPVYERDTLIDTASSLAISYSNNTFIPLVSTETIIDTASSLAVEYSDNTFIPLISTSTIIDTASSLAAVYANVLVGNLNGAAFVAVTDIPSIVNSASSLAVSYSHEYFVPLSSVESIVDSASSSAYAFSQQYSHDYFVPLSSVNSIVDTASSLSINYTHEYFVPLSSVDSIIDSASSLSVDYSDTTFIPLLSVNTLVNTASSLAVYDISSVKTVVETFSGAWLTPQKEFDYQLSAGTVDTFVSYSGTALYGSLPSDSVWTIKRLIYNNKGGVDHISKAVNVKWDDRGTTVIYL